VDYLLGGEGDFPLSRFTLQNLHTAHTRMSRGLTNVGCRKQVCIRVQKVVPLPCEAPPRETGLVGMSGLISPPCLILWRLGGRETSLDGMHCKSLCFQYVLDVGILQIDCFRSVYLIFEHVSSTWFETELCSVVTKCRTNY
jgi:hypothetical protein